MRRCRIAAVTILLVSALGLLIPVASAAAAATSHNAPVHAAGHIVTAKANTRVEQLAVAGRPGTALNAPIGGGGDDVCDAAQSISYNSSTRILNGRAWTYNCVGALQCVKVADLQHESPTDPGVWFTIQDGNSYNGCTEAHFAFVNKPCNTSTVYSTYRTLAFFTIFWDDGGVTGPVHYYSPSKTIKASC
jgi:hypothetical protein